MNDLMPCALSRSVYSLLTHLTERLNLEFRAGAFNVSNSPPLGQPNGVAGNAAFGFHHESVRPIVQNRKNMSHLALLILFLIVTPVWGWGPHSQIVDASLAVLPADDRLAARLGSNAERLRMYVMMGDWKDCVLEIQENWSRGDKHFGQMPTQIYTNDFLISPLSPRHFQHVAPDVMGTHKPFFLRALQALRTESPSNAARWLGSLLHFATDSGAPPHAAGFKGDLHSKTENWVDGRQIDITGYTPRLLGRTDDEALQGFLARMKALIEFSKQRAAKLRPLIEADDRPHSEPLVLESANESARASADMLHTLLVLSAKSSKTPVSHLSAEISAPTTPGFEAIPAKLILLETSYGTTSEPAKAQEGIYRGTVELRDLPPGTYTPVIYRTGCKTLFGKPLTLKAGSQLRQKWDLESETPAGNLVRNPDFQIRWTKMNQPEHWQNEGSKGYWASDNLKATPGKSYSAMVQLKTATQVKVALQWMQEHWLPLGEPIQIPLAGATFSAPAKASFAKLLIYCKGDPSLNVQSISVVERQKK